MTPHARRDRQRHATARRALILCLAVFPMLTRPARGHEVDQYAVPADLELVDLGDYWNHLLYDAVDGAVNETNFKIRQARLVPIQSARDALIAHYQSHDALAAAVRRRLPCALMAIEGLEAKIIWHNVVDAPAGTSYGHFAPVTRSVFSHWPLLPDPRQLGRMSLMRCSLVQIHGTRMGTDKIAHFISMGFVGFQTYRRQIHLGVNPEKAMQRTVGMAAQGPLGETSILGNIPTGIYSNADMAADYLGVKFYLNLMEPVTLRGEIVPPMVSIEDGLLVLQPHMQRDGPYFSCYISNHLDEVLNPSLHNWSMRDGVRRGVRQHSQDILAIYAGDDPDKRNPEYFDRLMIEYSTYFGESYGHSGQVENLITVGNTCFPRRQARR